MHEDGAEGSLGEMVGELLNCVDEYRSIFGGCIPLYFVVFRCILLHFIEFR